jgi:hypothetical protein
VQKFLVVSYDDDQQQWFWDFVAAQTPSMATIQVCADRPYVIAADATPLLQLQNTANHLAHLTVEQVENNYKRTIKEA